MAGWSGGTVAGWKRNAAARRSVSTPASGTDAEGGRGQPAGPKPPAKAGPDRVADAWSARPPWNIRSQARMQRERCACSAGLVTSSFAKATKERSAATPETVPRRAPVPPPRALPSWP